MIELRAPLRAFVERQEAILQENDHKAGWRDMSLEELLDRIAEEVEEVKTAIQDADWPLARKEACDVANFVFMLHDNMPHLAGGTFR